jgi:ketol-acid reductoisomerase
MSKMQFGSQIEQVTTRSEFSLAEAKAILSNEVIAIIGYGVQGPAQALNLRDNGCNVIIGQRENSASWDKACADGWVPNETLFNIEAACERATFICYLLSDAAQMQLWPVVQPYLTPGKTLYFSHGFAITYSDKTHIVPPSDIDVILVAPKGSGRSVRQLFLQGKGINASYAIHQDFSDHAEAKALAFGIAIGSGYLFKTTFKHEVFSDLVGERGALMGALNGVFNAQYNLLRKHGHSPSEAFNETVEELTQSLMHLVAEKGMDWMYSNCSTTAQRGALDWSPRFEAAVAPVFEELYAKVESGEEAATVIAANRREDYKAALSKELNTMAEQEIWRVGKQVRMLRASEV